MTPRKAGPQKQKPLPSLSVVSRRAPASCASRYLFFLQPRGGAVMNNGGDMNFNSGSLFEDNRADSNSCGGQGGAIYNYDGGIITYVQYTCRNKQSHLRRRMILDFMHVIRSIINIIRGGDASCREGEGHGDANSSGSYQSSHEYSLVFEKHQTAERSAACCSPTVIIWGDANIASCSSAAARLGNCSKCVLTHTGILCRSSPYRFLGIPWKRFA